MFCGLMKLYDMVKAPNPRRVRIFLAEKSIDVERQEVDISSGQNRQPDYLTRVRRGVVPALELDDGTIIDESIAICRYFEALQPDPPLFGSDPLGIARIESWQRRIEFDGMINVAAIFRNTAPHFAERAAPGAAPNTAQIPAMAERGLSLLPGFWSLLNEQLADTPFIAGPDFSVADITGLVTVDFAKWVKQRIPDDAPNVQRWYEQVSARPSAAA